MNWKALSYTSVFFLTSGVFAQESPRLPQPEQAGISPGRTFGTILFERHLNTFNWFGRAVIDTSVGPFSLKMNEQYTSNIILIDATPTSPEKRPESNQQSISLLPGWSISQNVALLGQWSSLVFSDN